ncbi:MAG: DUF1080 domain-containing protein [Verrucomicrobia bacterium]|nr:DUF1080 domain-containing protein [Verrucomicrobiota bacterium]
MKTYKASTLSAACAALALIFSLSASPLRAEDANGFVPLFNGRDLTGWVPLNVAADTFFVRDGMIIDTGLPIGLMRTARMYENFILELEWRHMKEAGNSGVFTWADGLPSVGGPFPRGIEVQVLDPGYAKRPGANEWFTTHGDIFPVRGATMTPTGRISKTGGRSFPVEDRTKPSPEWNHYRLVANRGELRLSVNGKEVTVGKDCVPRKGFLCLEAEGSECQFRNLRIKELPTSNTSPEQTANPYEGFRQLFNGKDFGGWKTNEAVNAVWSARGSHFVSKGGVKGRKLDLWTDKSYRDFVLYVDWRLTKKPALKALPTFMPDGLYARDEKRQIIRKEIPDAGDSGIFLRGDGRYQVNIWSQPMGSGDINELHKDEKLPADLRRQMLPKVKADAPFGKWNRFFITLKGDRVTVVLNDQTVIENCPLPGIASDGPIALQYHGDDLEFTNIFIREL